MDILHSTVFGGTGFSIRRRINDFYGQEALDMLKSKGCGILLNNRKLAFARYSLKEIYHLVELGDGVVGYLLCNSNPIGGIYTDWHISGSDEMASGFLKRAEQYLKPYVTYPDFVHSSSVKFTNPGRKNLARFLCIKCMTKYLKLKVKEKEPKMEEKNDVSVADQGLTRVFLYGGAVYEVRDPSSTEGFIRVCLGRAFMFNDLFRLRNDMRISELSNLIVFIRDTYTASMCRSLDLFGRHGDADKFMAYIKDKDCMIKFLLKHGFLVTVEVHRLGNEYDLYQLNRGHEGVYPGGPWRLSVVVPAEFPVREEGPPFAPWAPGSAYIGLVGIAGTIFGRPVRVPKAFGDIIPDDVMDKLMVTSAYRYKLRRTREQVELDYNKSLEWVASNTAPASEASVSDHEFRPGLDSEK